MAEDLLRGEGFNSVQYVELLSANVYDAFTASTIDISMAFVAPFITQIDVRVPLVLLGGVHAGCFELFGTGRVNAIRDLKGKTVAVPELGSPHHVFTAAMASHVGIGPNRDINFVTRPPAESMQLLADGKIDALMALLHLLRSGIGTTRANRSGEIRSADWGEVEALKTRCKACC